MSTLELGSLILAAEFALVAWGILFFMMRRKHQQSHADHAHVGAVMENLETTEVSRRDALATMFASTYRLEGEALEAKVNEYVAREKAFYNAMLSLYLERDGARLKDMPAELTKVLTPWATLTPSGMVHADDLSGLENEKAKLTAELENTQKTLDELMSEYAAAFSHSQPPARAADPPETVSSVAVAKDAEAMPDQDDFDFLSVGDDIDSIEAVLEQIPKDAPDAERDAAEPVSPPAESNAQIEDTAEKPPATDHEDLEYELAQDELEGLADLFGSPSSKT